MATNWTDELRARAIAEYIALSPTPETSAECIKEVATALGNEVTANGVRAILVKAGEYIATSKVVSTGTKAAKTAEPGKERVSKESAVAELVAAINDTGTEPDMDIIGKLTGKAALYFAGVLRKSQAGE